MVPRLNHMNPFLQPHWRAERALELIDRHRKPSREDRDDKYVRAYFGYLQALGNDDQPEGLSSGHEGVHAAYLLRYCSNAYDRDVIEARLLARQSPKKIAETMAMDLAVVTNYTKIFFDVRPRLN